MVDHVDENFEAIVRGEIETIKTSRRSTARANSLLRMVGCKSKKQWEISPYFPRPPAKYEDVVVEALVVGIHTYCSHGAGDALHMQQALSGLYAIGRWRECLDAPVDVHAFVRSVVFFATYSAYVSSRALEMLNDWLAPEKRYKLAGDEGGSLRLQGEILKDMFGDPWWTFNAPEEGRRFDFNRITVQRPGFRTGLVPEQAVQAIMALDLPTLG